MPESPRWLIHKGREYEAKHALLRLRGLHTETDEFNEEFGQMIIHGQLNNSPSLSIIINDDKKISRIRRLCEKIHNLRKIVQKSEIWKPFVILNTFFLFQQFCGIYVIIGYAVDLVIGSGITVDPFFITVMIGVVQTAGGVALVLCSSRYYLYFI